MKIMRFYIQVFILLVLGVGTVLAAQFDFASFITIPTLSSPRGIAVGNFFGQGMNGVAVANFGSPTFIGQTTPATLLNPQTSGIQIFTSSPIGLKLSQTVVTGASPRGVFAFDLGNKGKQDLLVTAYDANLLQVYTWDGSQFLKTSEKATLAMPVGVAAGLGPHGAPLAAVADFGSNVLSLFHIKAGKLGDRVDIPVSAGPVQVAIGDLRGNGSSEIAVACLIAHQIVLLSRNPTAGNDDLGSYSIAQTLIQPEGCELSDLRVADINGDGKMDLVSVDFQKGLLFAYLQAADGSLVAQPPVPTSGLHPNGMTIADLSGDGKKEIIVANRDSDSLDLFRWAGNSFQLLKTLKVANDAVSNFGPVEVAAMDTTGQGKLDLVTSHMRSNSIRVLTQNLSLIASDVKAQLLGPAVEGATFSEETTTCYPNPSHDGKVRISFKLPSPSSVNIQIFDVGAEVVWSQSLAPSQTQPGINSVNWDGNNLAGENLASGMYLCHITVGGASVTKKIAIIH